MVNTVRIQRLTLVLALAFVSRRQRVFWRKPVRLRSLAGRSSTAQDALRLQTRWLSLAEEDFRKSASTARSRYLRARK